MVAYLVLVLGYQSLHRLAIKKAVFRQPLGIKPLIQQRVELAAQPYMFGEHNSLFGPVQNFPGQVFSGDFFQYIL